MLSPCTPPLVLDPALQVVMTPVAGQVRVTHLQVGREVQAGEVLVELDSTAQRLGPLTLLADLQPQKTAVETTHRSLQQLVHAQQVQAAEWHARLAQHQREVVVLEGELAVAEARLARLASALEDTTLRAASAGRLGAVAALLPGTVVQAGAWLGILGPRGAFLVTVDVPPAVAGGRL